MRTSVKFVLVGNYQQLPAVEKPRRKYVDSLALKELVDLLHRSDDSVSLLFDIVETLKPSDFDNGREFIRVNMAHTHAKWMVKRDKLKKKAMLKISKNDPHSQDVSIMVGTPLIATRNYKAMGIINSATYVVKKIKPSITIVDTFTKQELTITTEQFQLYFWVNYCSTIHKLQGDSINEPFTIHEGLLCPLASNTTNTVTVKISKKIDDTISIRTVHHKCQTNLTDLRWKELDNNGSVTVQTMENGISVIDNFLTQVFRENHVPNEERDDD
ncbi:UNVERIFIED_CONTAM: hypothetical protein HDU68_002092 [Siphonaria sp. JEL0065]|nr:hypothetical protein HDU68_002092 [Siphonaria sp. JEL0065]